MGIGGGIFLIALGAILAFALRVDSSVIDLEITGWVLILSGATVLALTVWFWRSRRRKQPEKPKPEEISLVEQTRIAHGHAVVEPPQSGQMQPPPRP